MKDEPERLWHPRGDCLNLRRLLSRKCFIWLRTLEIYRETSTYEKSLRNVTRCHDSGWLQLLSLGELNLVKVRTKGRRRLPKWHCFVLYPFAKLEQDAWKCPSPANRSHVKRYTGSYCGFREDLVDTEILFSCSSTSPIHLPLCIISWPFLDLKYFFTILSYTWKDPILLVRFHCQWMMTQYK